MAIVRSDIIIPPEYVREIIQATVQESAALRLCRRVTMPTGESHLPVMATLPSGGFVNPRDTGRKMQSQASWDQVVLTAEEIAVIVTVPQAVIDDANFDIFSEITPRVAEKFGQIIDLATLFGVGAPATFPTGGVAAQAIAASNTRARGSVTGEDIAQDVNYVMAMIEEQGFEAEGFVARPTLKAMLRGLRSSIGTLLFQPSLQANTPDTLYGTDIMYSRNAGWDPTVADLLVGDWDYAVIGLRQDMNIRVLTEATFTDGSGNVTVSLAETDQVALRCYMRLGFALANPVTIAAPDSGSRSPFAVLAPHA